MSKLENDSVFARLFITWDQNVSNHIKQNKKNQTNKKQTGTTAYVYNPSSSKANIRWPVDFLVIISNLFNNLHIHRQTLSQKIRHRILEEDNEHQTLTFTNIYTSSSSSCYNSCSSNNNLQGKWVFLNGSHKTNICVAKIFSLYYDKILWKKKSKFKKQVLLWITVQKKSPLWWKSHGGKSLKDTVT